MSETDKMIPKLLLQQFLLGELPAEKKHYVETLISENAEVRSQLESLKKEQLEFATRFPYEQFSNVLEHESKIQQRQKLASLASFATICIVVVSLLIAFPKENRVEVGDFGDLDDIIRLKGVSQQLHVYRKRGTEIEELLPNDSAFQRDLIQLSYVAAGDRYGAIFSVDGNGGMTLHFPEHIGDTGELKPQGEVHLDHAYRLDDAPEFERFYFVSSRSPVAWERIWQQGQHQAQSGNAEQLSLELDDDIHLQTITIRKKVQP
ncbi:MAG: hypothetical protein OEZ43_20825 [Gammaproteobacteria bacterium]|nr:hypothetical protein [Gammaproteobacteria bacterium]